MYGLIVTDCLRKQYKIGDPRWSGPDGARLSFRAHSASVPQEIVIKVADAVVNGQANEYVATVALQAGGDEWQQIVLALGDFVPVEESGRALGQWKELLVLWVLPPGNEVAFADAGLVFTDFGWLFDRANL